MRDKKTLKEFYNLKKKKLVEAEEVFVKMKKLIGKLALIAEKLEKVEKMGDFNNSLKKS